MSPSRSKLRELAVRKAELEKQLEYQKNKYAYLIKIRNETNRKLFGIRAAIDMPELYLDNEWNVFGYSQNFLALSEKANEFANERGNLKDFLNKGDFERLLEYVNKVKALEDLPYDEGEKWRLRYKGPKKSDRIGKDWIVSLNCSEKYWKVADGMLIHEPHIQDRVDCYLMTASEYGGADEDIKVVYRVKTSGLKENISDLTFVISGSSGRNDTLCDRIGYTICSASNENTLARIQRKIADIVSYPEVLEPDTEYLITVERTGGRILRLLKNLRTGEEAAPLQLIDPEAIYNYQNHIGFQTFSGELKISSIEVYTRKSRFSIDRFRIPFDFEVGIRDERVKHNIFKLRMSQYASKGVMNYTLMFEDITQRKINEKNLIKEHLKLELSLKHERLLSDIAYRLNSSDSFQKVLGEFLLAIGQAMGLDCAAFYRIDNDKGKAVRLDFWCSEVCSTRGELSKEISLSRIPEFVKRLKGGERVFILHPRNLKNETARFLACKFLKSMLVSCLVISGEIKGFICFARIRNYSWKAQDINIFNTIADMMISTWERDMHFQARLEAEKKHTEAVQMVEKAAHMASIGVMAAGLTHEINQPLSSIKVTADSILYWDKRNKGVVPEFFVNKLDKISRGVKRINDIIRHMRSFWISPDRLEENAVNLNETVVSALSLIDHQLHAHEIETKIVLNAAELPVRGNWVHLEQIVINLVVNSMHALDELPEKDDKKITIRTCSNNNFAQFEVIDNGIGLPEGIGDEIFDPFYTTKKPGRGTGLGLAIVRRFVDEHAGSIEVANNPEGGTTLRVKFPIYKTDETLKHENSVG